MKVLVICGGGISTNIVVESMLQYVDDIDEIKALSYNNAVRYYKQFDVVLVAPQIKHLYEKISKICEGDGVVCGLISFQDYGSMNGKNVYRLAQRLYAQKIERDIEQKRIRVAIGCISGLSSRLLCTGIEDAGKEFGYEITCKNFGSGVATLASRNFQIILLTPPLFFMKDYVQSLCSNVPVYEVEVSDYGSMNCREIIRKALELYEGMDE